MQLLFESNGTAGTALSTRILKNQTHYSFQALQSGTWITLGTGAAQTELADSGSYFTSTDVEGALQEIGSTLSGLQTALEAI